MPQSACNVAPEAAPPAGAARHSPRGSKPKAMLASFRFLAALFLLIAVIAGVWDGTRSLAADRLVTASLLEHWTAIAPKLLDTAQAAVTRIHPMLWNGGVGRLLEVPATVFFVALGLAFAYAGRRRRRINVFAN
jgi:hypothetical protein